MITKFHKKIALKFEICLVALLFFSQIALLFSVNLEMNSFDTTCTILMA